MHYRPYVTAEFFWYPSTYEYDAASNSATEIYRSTWWWWWWWCSCACCQQCYLRFLPSNFLRRPRTDFLAILPHRVVLLTLKVMKKCLLKELIHIPFLRNFSNSALEFLRRHTGFHVAKTTPRILKVRFAVFPAFVDDTGRSTTFPPLDNRLKRRIPRCAKGLWSGWN